jgi:putative membrane protein
LYHKSGKIVAYDEAEKKDLIIRDYLAAERTHLANERTLLAYLRSALILFVAAITIFKFFQDSALMKSMVYILALLAVLTMIFGFYRFYITRKKLKVFGK